MDYGQMSHADLLALRASLADSDPRQAQIAPYEHQAFAREWTEANPTVAVPSLAVAIPGYYGAKLLGLIGARTRPSFDEVRGGYRGIGQGLLALMRNQR